MCKNLGNEVAQNWEPARTPEIATVFHAPSFKLPVKIDLPITCKFVHRLSYYCCNYRSPYSFGLPLLWFILITLSAVSLFMSIMDINITAFKIYNNLYNKVRRRAKKIYFEKQFSKNSHDIKKTWTLIRELLGMKKGKDQIPDFFREKIWNLNKYKFWTILKRQKWDRF